MPGFRGDPWVCVWIERESIRMLDLGNGGRPPEKKTFRRHGEVTFMPASLLARISSRRNGVDLQENTAQIVIQLGPPLDPTVPVNQDQHCCMAETAPGRLRPVPHVRSPMSKKFNRDRENR